MGVLERSFKIFRNKMFNQILYFLTINASLPYSALSCQYPITYKKKIRYTTHNIEQIEKREREHLIACCCVLWKLCMKKAGKQRERAEKKSEFRILKWNCGKALTQVQQWDWIKEGGVFRIITTFHVNFMQWIVNNNEW